MRVSMILLGFLVACGVQEDVPAETGTVAELPVDANAPTFTRTLTVGPVLPGASFTATVAAVPPGFTMTLVGSANVNGAGWCPPQIAPACTDIAQPLRTLGTATAGANGEVVFSVMAPANMPAQVELMAYGRSGQNYAYTNAVLVTPVSSGDDTDRDGLINGDELAWGTDPFDADSDNGGTPDGAEVSMGTDPLNGADDIPLPCNGTSMDPGNGIMGCWYTAPVVGMTCDDVCSTHGGFDAAASQHTGNAAGVFFWPGKNFGSDWETIECSSTDNNTNWGANGAAPLGWWSHPACHVNCACMN